jgi:hypothetical protein
MISVESIQCAVKVSFEKETEASEAVAKGILQTGAQVEGKWYGEGSMGIPFTEDLTKTEMNLLSELLTTVAARVAGKKEQENLAAPHL